jgi:hypothetical protein
MYGGPGRPGHDATQGVRGCAMTNYIVSQQSKVMAVVRYRAGSQLIV